MTRRRNDAKRMWLLPSSLFLLPCPPPRPHSRCRMSKNRRVSAAHIPHYHVLVGMQTLFFTRVYRRVGWRREQFRSAASVVSALSSFVANGHQTMPSFPPPPLKFRTAGFPQYGFKLAPATATFAPRAYRPPLRLLSECGVWSVVGLRQAAPHPSDRATSPVALGSPTGYSVRPAHRLLWPHPSLWPGAPAYGLFPARSPVPEIPQFTSRVC